MSSQVRVTNIIYYNKIRSSWAGCQTSVSTKEESWFTSQTVTISRSTT